LRFAENKSLVDATTGSNLVTFTRASSGTFVGSDGVIRTAVTNLLLRSEEFGTSWTATRASVSSDVIASPLGTVTADALIEDTSVTLSHVLVQGSLSIVSGLNYTFSCYAKRASGSRNVSVTLRAATFGSNMRAIVDLSTGAVTAIGTVVESGATPIGDGWWRVWVTATATASATSSVDINLADGASLAYTGDGTSGIYLWGAQLEQSSTVGEYIPTTSTINSAPRFDHNPTTGESLGLLVEEQRTNLLLRSEEFDDASWTGASPTVTPNVAISPGGTSTADKIEIAPVRQTLSSLTAGANYAVSFYIKSDETTAAAIRLRTGFAGGAGNVWWIPSTGLAGTVGSTFSNATAILVGSNWYRFSAIFTVPVGVTSVEFAISGVSADGGGTISGHFVIWGAQVEAGAFPTSYIPTTTAAVTRSADVASISQTNATGKLGFTSGTIYGQAARYNNATGTTTVFQVDDGTTANRVLIGTGSSGVAAQTYATAIVSGVNVASFGTTALSSNKFAFSYQTDSYLGSFNGGLESDTSGTMPVIDQTAIGSNRGTFFNGTIARICAWPKPLPGSTLQAMTG
jgi:hypothetical protein